MPGRGSYGKGGKWIYQRAKHIRSKNPDMDESASFAIATQQAHKLGKSPKKFRTERGVARAHAKYRGPEKMYKKTAESIQIFEGQNKTAAPVSVGKILRRARRKLPIQAGIQEGLSVVEPAVITSTRKKRTGGRTKTASLFKAAVSEYAKTKRRERRRANKKAKVKAQIRAEGLSTKPKLTPTPPPKPGFAPTLRGRGGRPIKIVSTTVEPVVGKVKQTAKREWRVRPLHTAPKDAVKKVSKLRRYGLPAGAALGALAVGGMLHRSHKKDKADIERFFKGGNEKQAMIRGLFDELEKISQTDVPTPPAPGMGAASPSAMGAPGSSGGNAAAAPPPLTSPVTSPVGGGVKAGGMPTAKMGT